HPARRAGDRGVVRGALVQPPAGQYRAAPPDAAAAAASGGDRGSGGVPDLRRLCHGRPRRLRQSALSPAALVRGATQKPSFPRKRESRGRKSERLPWPPASAGVTTSGFETMDPMPSGSSFQALILKLQNYWAEQGCVILQPYDVEVGAGTFHPA